MKSILIKDTTREEREKIVAEGWAVAATVQRVVPAAAWRLTISST